MTGVNVMSQSQNNDVVLHSDASDLFNKFRVPVNLVKEFKEHGYKDYLIL